VPIDDSLLDGYIDALLRELSLRDIKEPTTIYIGGGTPTTLPIPHLRRLLEGISPLLDGAKESTIEANSGTIDREKLKLLRDLGINRLSIGVQSLRDEELRTLGRLYGSKTAIESVLMAGEFFENISIDLIYGIPSQKIGQWEETLDSAISLPIKHISAYELTPERGTPFYDLISKGTLSLPKEDTIVEMFHLTSKRLLSEGFFHYEISNYAKEGFECRHNINYWMRGQYIGLGAGAHTFLDGKRIKNIGNIPLYIDRVFRGQLPIETEEVLSPEDSLREEVFLSLRTSYGIEARQEILKASEFALRAGLMELVLGRLRLTEGAMAVSNSVITEILRRLGL
jgi:oxygen-independent coproporphyrinogen-3 oxidase